jgi:adenylate kinase family enzyme
MGHAVSDYKACLSWACPACLRECPKIRREFFNIKAMAEMDEPDVTKLSPAAKLDRRPRYSYIIVGKPGCGATTLATKLANFTQAKLINPVTAIENSLNAPEYGKVLLNLSKIYNELSQGREVTHSQVVSMMKNEIQQDEADFKGFVLEGLPGKFSVEDLEVLKVAIERQNQVPVLVQLHISDENLMQRRAARWVDPVTSLTYPGQQVLYSRLRRSEGYVDGEEDSVAVGEQQDMTGLEAGAEEKEKEKEKQDEEEDEDGAIKEEAKPKKVWEYNLKNQQCWTILSEQVLGRLIKYPQDDPALFVQDIVKYSKSQADVDLFRQSNFNVLNIVDLDASQHPDVVFGHLKKRMLVLGYSIYNPVIHPKRLPSLEGGFKGVPDAEVFKYYLTSDVGEPPRHLSIFKKICPVTFFVTGELHDCDLSYSVLYKVLSR